VDEVIDLVDEFDNVVGQGYKNVIYKKGLKNFRVINGFLKNNFGEIWIPRRSLQKKLFPLHLDASVGGHVKSGESYKDAFFREIMEELNIDAEKTKYRLVGQMNPIKDGVSAFMMIYEVETNLSPDFNRNDFLEASWQSPSKLREILDSGEPSKGDLSQLLKFVYKV
jgi:isopentenyldiphosphate isomerase